MSVYAEKPCRLCCSIEVPKVDVFNDKPNLYDWDIPNSVHTLFNFWILPTDTKTTLICVECVEQVKSFYSFYLKVKAVQKNLWEYGEDVTNVTVPQDPLAVTSIKEEEPDIDIDVPDSDEIPLSKLSKNLTKSDVETKDMDVSLVRCTAEEVHLEKYFKDTVQINEITKETAMKKSSVDTLNTLEFPSELFKNGRLLVTGRNIDVLLDRFYNIECDICQMKPTCGTHKKLFEHYVAEHNTNGYVVCCGEYLKNRQTIISHMVYHLQPNAYRCKVCEKVFRNDRGLRKHKSTHLPENLKFFQCNQCDRGFTDRIHLVTHKETHVPVEQRKKYECTKCDKTFTISRYFVMHNRTVHSEKSFLCSECGKAFKTKPVLKLHMRSHCRSRPSWDGPPPGVGELDPVQCKDCGFTSKNKKCLRVHVKQYHMTERQHCVLCDFSTFSIYNLRIHVLNKHSNDRPYGCDQCDKKFKRKQQLTIHKEHHSGDRKYICSLCPSKFASVLYYNKHMRRQHPNNSPTFRTLNKEWKKNNRQVPVKAVELNIPEHSS